MSTPATWTASCTSGAGECGSGGVADGLASGWSRWVSLQPYHAVHRAPIILTLPCHERQIPGVDLSNL